MKKIFTFALATLTAVAAAYAIPAKRGFRTLEQPDGSTIRVELVGDEFSHYYRTDDNVILLPGADGVLRYAGTDAQGKLTLSDIKAQNAAVRSAEGQLAVSKASNAAVLNALRDNALRKFEAGRRTADEVYGKARRAAAAADDDMPAQSGLGLFTGNYPRTGKVHGIVFLVQYRDVRFNVSDPNNYFSRMLNEEGFSDNGGTGSAREYFLDQSNGLFDVTFDVYGPVTLSQNRSYYGGNDNYGNDRNAEKMVTEGAQLLANEVDFSNYDFDNDGNVDNIFVIYAGTGEASGGPAESVWPHSWTIPTNQQIVLNGKRIAGYACANEWDADNTPTGIGTVCHEFSHVMGLPDLYCTNGNTLTCTPGEWNVMDYGPYNNDGNTPPNYSAFERNAMGWLDLKVLDGPESVVLDPIHVSNEAALIQTENKEEFFLLENRQQEGWDKYIPYHGMLVWHIDFNQNIWDQNIVNNNRQHQYVDIEEANTTPNTNSVYAMRGYPFPGTSRKTSFTSTTSPALKSWANKGIDMPITDINETDGIITFDVAGGHITLDAPAAPAATAANNGTIAVTWKAVDKADNYLLNVYTRDAQGTAHPLAAYTDFETGNVTSYTVEGAEGETEYFVTVTAAKGRTRSDASAETAVTTPAVDMIYITPTATSASTANGTATFTWQPVKNAAKYLLTVELPSAGGDKTDATDFGSGDQLVIPDAWSWNGASTDIYGSRSTGYIGESAPALKFTGSGKALSTPVYGGDVLSVEFWLRGASPSGNSTISVQGRNAAGEDWITLRDIILVNEAKIANTFTVTPSEKVRQIQFLYTKVAGNAALDDVKVKYSTKTFSATDDMTRLDAGAQTSYTMPLASDECYFYIEAMDAAGRLSKPSNKVYMQPGSTGICSPSDATTATSVETGAGFIAYSGASGETVRIISLTGAIVAEAVTDTEGRAEFSLPAGFYVVSAPKAAVKAIVR